MNRAEVIERLKNRIVTCCCRSGGMGEGGIIRQDNCPVCDDLKEAIALLSQPRMSEEEMVKFINDWLSHRHGFQYDGVLARDFAKALSSKLEGKDE